MSQQKSQENQINFKVASTREEWLENAVKLLTGGVFARNGLEVPAVRVSVGFALGSRKAVGQHWSPAAAADNKGQILISPIQNGLEAIDTLVHELVHAAVGNDKGHGPAFRKAALSVGLEGKMRSAAAGEALRAELSKMIEEKLGEYPHARLVPAAKPGKPQTTRMLKMICEHCGYIARASNKCIEEKGALICPCEGEPMSVEVREMSEG